MTRISSLLLCVLVISICGCNQGLKLKGVKVKRAPLEESFREPARTRLPRDWMIHMPVSGRIGRISLQAGDRVKKGLLLAEFDLLPLKERVRLCRSSVAELQSALNVQQDNTLERTTLADALLAVKAAREALKAADAEIEAETKRSDRAAVELSRSKVLFAKKAISQSKLDDDQLDADTALIALRKQQFNRASLQAMIVAIELGPRFVREYLSRKKLETEGNIQRLVQSKARLEMAEHDLSLAKIVSPIDGIVLERISKGSRVLTAGAALLRLGCLSDMDAFAEVLSEDALRLRAGTPVELRSSTTGNILKAKVERVEPAAFTKHSSLGVEQQRVRVIICFEGTPPQELGEAYRLQARFITAVKKSALLLPRFCVLQHEDGSHYVFVIKKGRLCTQVVKLGLQSDRHLEILSGLTEGQVVVSHPDTTFAKGDKANYI